MTTSSFHTPMNSTVLITIDVEDWFQVENLKPWIPSVSWPSCQLRVERSTHCLLDLLDSFRPLPAATFFVLGWIAQRLPGLVREIHARGHEVASHGCTHELCMAQSRDALWQDLVQSKKMLEDITGQGVFGYRAPSFSINEEILEYISEAGYLYDASYNSFSMHGRYGRLSVHRNGNGASTPVLMQPVKGLYELPISNIQMGRHVIPWGGGAYFRLIPERIFRSGIRHILKSQRTYIMYLHPWEVDPEQPRVKQATITSKFRHYSNLGKTRSRLKNLINSFSNCNFITCKNYITQTQQNRSSG